MNRALAWEPSVAQVTSSSYYRRLPALDLIMIVAIFPFKSRPTQLRISNQHSRGSPEFPNKNLRQIGLGVHEL